MHPTLHDRSILVGWDFSTGAVKAVAFDMQGQVVHQCHFPTDLWTTDGVSELNLLLLEGQARATARAMAAGLRELGRLQDWAVAGISATHHTSSRIDENNNPIRRAICWNDQTLASYHKQGLERLGGRETVEEFIGGPWAVRYSLSHLVKDEATLSEAKWKATRWIQSHGSLAAGYLTGKFDCISVSSAASTGLLDLRSATWQPKMLRAIHRVDYQVLASANLPRILSMNEPVGPLSESIAADCGLPEGVRPIVYPTLDDQAAGLAGGGAVAPGQLAIILGNSAVVNSSFATLPKTDQLDVMRLNWGPFLAMRCYSNGAQFLDRIVGSQPDWHLLEQAGAAVPPGCDGVTVSPFILSEPSLNILEPKFGWNGPEPTSPGVRVRAAYEAVAYLIALAVEAHEATGQAIEQITVSGGMARSELMLTILASVLNRRLERLVSEEGSALGAAVAAYAGTLPGDPIEAIQAATKQLVKFKSPIVPRQEWLPVYHAELNKFRAWVNS